MESQVWPLNGRAYVKNEGKRTTTVFVSIDEHNTFYASVSNSHEPLTDEAAMAAVLQLTGIDLMICGNRRGLEMANHAYVCSYSLPPVEEIDRDVREIISRKFPQFSVDFDAERKYWLVHYQNDGYIALEFWVDETGLPEDFDEETEDWSKKCPCIEFRHGHAYQFLWWVEYEIREELAARYSARTIDDGIGEYQEAYRNCPTYREYLKMNQEARSNIDDSLLGFREQLLNEELQTLPEPLRPLIG